MRKHFYKGKLLFIFFSQNPSTCGNGINVTEGDDHLKLK